MLQLAKASPDKKGHFEPAQLKRIIELLKKFSAGLDYGAAVTQDERGARELMIVEAGRELTAMFDLWLNDRPFGLEQCGVLDSMIRAQVMIRRVLTTWRFLPTIEVNDAAY